MFFSKNKSVVGVDIGTAFIKVAQVTHGTKKTLDTYGIVNASVSFDAHANQMSIMTAADVLKRLLAEAQVTAKNCIVSLPNNAVFTSVIEMQQLSEDQMESAISFEAKKYIPLPLAEVVLSWSVVSKDSQLGRQKVLLIAVPKQVQQSYIQLFAMTGLELSIIEIEALALIRSLSTSSVKNSVIIDIGARNTGLNVVMDGVLQLTRNLSIGGATITDTIAKTLNVSIPRAEQFKKDFGLSNADFIPETIKPVMSTIKNEVKQLVSIYAARSVPVQKLILTGGGSNLPGIVTYFQDLGIPVEFGNPLANVGYDPSIEPVIKRFATQLPVAIGLAMRDQE